MAEQSKPKTVFNDFNLDTTVPDVQPLTQTIQPVENTGGLGAADLAPSNLNADQSTIVPETPSPLVAIGASMFSTARDWYGGYKEDVVFEKDPYYNPNEDAQAWLQVNGQNSIEESEYLNGAESYDAMLYRQQRLEDRRNRQLVQAQRPYWSMAGSLADADLVANFIPVVGQGKVIDRLATGAIAATAAGAVTLGNDNSIRSAGEQALDPLLFGLGGLFGSVKVGKAVTQVNVDEVLAKAAIEPPVMQKGRLKVQSGQVLAESDLPKPTVRLYAGMDDALNEIKAEQATKASTDGHMATANVMGVNLEIPLSQPVRIQNWTMPDWYKNTFGKWTESSADRMYRMTGDNPDNPLNNLLASPRTQGQNATYHAAAINSELESLLVRFEDQLDTATTRIYGTKGWNPLNRKDHIANQQQVMRAFQEGMQTVDRIVAQREKAGIKTSVDDIELLFKEFTTDEHIRDLQMAYVRSGFAETAYDHMARVGLIDDELKQVITRRPTYTPLRHSYDKLNSTLKSGIDPDTLYKFIGEQILSMYPAMQGKNFSLTAKQLGQNFVRTQERAQLDLADMTSTGISSDKMREILKGTKLTTDQVEEVIGKIVPKSDESGANAMKNLRTRIDWNWDYKVTDKRTGRVISMADIVDTDIALTLNDYARTTSKRVGLAQYGYKTPAELDDALENLVSNKPADMSLDEAKNFAKNAKATLLGQAVGEALPQSLRSLNTVGGSMILSNSGIWGVMDLATQTAKIGLVRTLPQLLKGMKHAVTPLKGLSKADANTLYDILTQRLSTEGRWRNFSMRFEDNFEVSKGISERIAYYGQGTRFMNFSEAVKRMQVGIMGGVFTSAFEGAAKGNAKDIKFLRNQLKMDDALIERITKEWSTHGSAIDNWNGSTRVAMEQKVFFEADNMAHTIRTGELPAFLEHSSVGKAIFPFLSFTMAMQQKVINHTMARDGLTGMALLMAVQLPMAVVLGMAKNIKDGKEYDEKLASTSMNALSMLGIWSVPLGALDQGGFRGGATAFTPFNKGISVANKLFSEDSDISARDLKSATPFVGAMTALDLVLSSIEEE
jgi:hypothetical protein